MNIYPQLIVKSKNEIALSKKKKKKKKKIMKIIQQSTLTNFIIQRQHEQKSKDQ